MDSALTRITVAEHQADIMAALRRMDGRATVGDVVAATGLGSNDAEAGLKVLLEDRRGHIAVSESGEILYTFDPKLIRRGTEPALVRVRRAAWNAFVRAFKAWIVITLVVYFVIFVVLVIAALLASQRGGDSRRGGGWGRGGHRRGGVFPVPNFWLWYWIWGPRWRLGRPYYGRRWERTLPKDDRVPFYKKVFAFVFGPDRPRPTRQQLDRGTLRLIRARKGVLTTAELVEYTGLPLPEAEEEMARLVGAYGGEPRISPEGELVYAFPELMVSAHGAVSVREPNPAWLRLEYPLELTGNTPGANAAVVGINAFNLAAAASAPWFIFPRLGIGGPAAFVGLVIVPVVFSAMFFGVPLLRMLSVKRDNRRRAGRNVRKVLLGFVYRDALEGGEGVTLEAAHAHVASRLEQQKVTRRAVEAALHALAAEFDAEVSPDPDGTLRFRFPEVRKQFAAGEALRQSLHLEGRRPGDIVYSSADTPAEADARDLAALDRELDLTPYLPAPDRIGFEDDYEVVAFDEELRRRQPVRA